MRRCFTPPSLAPLLFALLLLLLLQGGEKFVRAEEAYLDECCQKGLIWAREKLRCEKFSGALPGVSKAELPACYETIEICCVKAFQEAQCELGKRDARADQVCRGVNAEEPPSGSSLGLGDFRRSCCEACKLGLLSGSDGKACDKKFSLGAAWDPAYAECCLGANKTRTSRMAAGNNGNILDTTDNNELDFDFSDSTDFTTSAPLDLCKLLKGLLCTDICVPTPNSYYCKCKDGMVLQPDGRSCQPNVTTTVAPLVKSTSTSAATKPKTTSTPKVTTSTSSSAAKPKTTSKPKSTSTAKPKTTSAPKTSKTTTSKNNLDTDFDHRTSMKLMQSLKSTSTSASKPTSTSAPKSTTSTTTHRTTSAKKTPRTTTKHVETTTKIRRTTGAKSTVEKTIEQMLNHLTTGREHHRSTRSASAEDNELGQTTCPSGYRFTAANTPCEDIDECTEGSHNCGEQKCYNLPGTFQCAKAPLPAARRKPTTSPATTAKTPANTTTTRPSSATGEKCSPGHRYDQKLGRCVDVDECAEQEEACSSSNEECRNTEGSFECVCRPGFRRDGLTRACIDINECQLKNDCLPSQRCDNTIGSYVCVRFLPCGTGYTLNAATEICEDDDECALATHDCGPGYHCRNTLGSFRCDKLRGGRPPSYSTTTTTTTTTTTAMPTTRRTSRPTFRTTPRTPGNLTTAIPIARVTTAQPKITSSTTTPRGSVNSTALTTTTEEIPTVRTLTTATVKPKTTSVAVRPRTNCPRGFEVGSFGQCIDIDECNRNVKLCGIQRCINTLGSFKCEPKVLCDIGYIPDRITGQCKDIDECAQGTHKCGPQQTCENRPGGYVCYCPSGFEVGGDHKCVDIDECSRVAGLCGSGGRCVNSPGSYSCICRHGFENDPANGGCRDVDECMSSKPCHQECYNTWGGHRCACRFGYRLRPDNRTCEDVDECTEFKDNHLCLGICDNTPGSYVCRCPEGYNLSEDGRTCVDIDECATGNACKATGDLCQNLRGSFRCNRIICPPGYIRDTHRTNRCMRESRFCPMHDQACLQRPAHYTYNYIGIVAMYPIPPNTGQVELFTMRGAYDLPGSSVRFNLALISARSPPRVRPATEDCFALRIPFPAQAVLVMTKSLQGPQDVELELSMEIYGPNNVLAGSAVAKIFIIVTQYEF